MIQSITCKYIFEEIVHYSQCFFFSLQNISYETQPLLRSYDQKDDVRDLIEHGWNILTPIERTSVRPFLNKRRYREYKDSYEWRCAYIARLTNTDELGDWFLLSFMAIFLFL